LKLGQLNAINALTRLAGNNAGAIFLVDNDSVDNDSTAAGARGGHLPERGAR
jgi:hypothetical protein